MYFLSALEIYFVISTKYIIISFFFHFMFSSVLCSGNSIYHLKICMMTFYHRASIAPWNLIVIYRWDILLSISVQNFCSSVYNGHKFWLWSAVYFKPEFPLQHSNFIRLRMSFFFLIKLLHNWILKTKNASSCIIECFCYPQHFYQTQSVNDILTQPVHVLQMATQSYSYSYSQ